MLRDALRLIQSRGEPMTTVQVDRLIEALDRLTDATVEQTRCTIEATAAIIATGRGLRDLHEGTKDMCYELRRSGEGKR